MADNPPCGLQRTGSREGSTRIIFGVLEVLAATIFISGMGVSIQQNSFMCSQACLKEQGEDLRQQRDN